MGGSSLDALFDSKANKEAIRRIETLEGDIRVLQTRLDQQAEHATALLQQQNRQADELSVKLAGVNAAIKKSYNTLFQDIVAESDSLASKLKRQITDANSRGRANTIELNHIEDSVKDLTKTVQVINQRTLYLEPNQDPATWKVVPYHAPEASRPLYTPPDDEEWDPPPRKFHTPSKGFPAITETDRARAVQPSIKTTQAKPPQAKCHARS
jgi:predicted  nucleic acid-binding Zn-ribbon protein